MFLHMDVEPKIGGWNTPKMDGENNGKPYYLMDDLGSFPIFLETPICIPWKSKTKKSGWSLGLSMDSGFPILSMGKVWSTWTSWVYNYIYISKDMHNKFAFKLSIFPSKVR